MSGDRLGGSLALPKRAPLGDSPSLLEQPASATLPDAIQIHSDLEFQDDSHRRVVRLLSFESEKTMIEIAG